MTPAVQSVHEPAVRMAISGIDQVLDYYIPHLPTDTADADAAIGMATAHLAHAKDYLREWAIATDIKIQSGMKT